MESTLTDTILLTASGPLHAIRRMTLGILAVSCGLLAGCSLPIHVGGAVYELNPDGSIAGPIPDAIVTYTRQDVADPITYNDTTLDPSGAYSMDIYQGEYLVQLAHPDFSPTSHLPDDPDFAGFWEMNLQTEGVDRYTINLWMVSRGL